MGPLTRVHAPKICKSALSHPPPHFSPFSLTDGGLTCQGDCLAAGIWVCHIWSWAPTVLVERSGLCSGVTARAWGRFVSPCPELGQLWAGAQGTGMEQGRGALLPAAERSQQWGHGHPAPLCLIPCVSSGKLQH